MPSSYDAGWWRVFSTLRGLLNPLVDARIERDQQILAIVREADVEERAAVRTGAPPAP